MNTSESSETSDEFFFEFFTNRPTLFTIYLTLTLVISIIGAFLNFVIIFVKYKSFKDSNGFDILTINMAAAQLFVSLSSVLFLVDEIHYKLNHHSWCGLKFYSHSFSTVLVGYSCVVALIVSLFLKEPKKVYGFTQAIAVWILGVIIAYPYVDVGLFEVPISSGTKFICVLKFMTVEEVKNFRTIMTVFDYFIPSGLIILSSILALALKRQEIVMKNFIVYPMILGFYFIISCSYISLVDFFFFYAGIHIKMSLYTTWKFFYATITIVNVVTCFWMDQNFYHRCLQFLRVDRGNVKISYINVKNEKEEDINSVSFEQI